MTDAHSPFADEALPPVYLAPMAGFTDAPFRLLCREQGCGHTVTEMVSAKGLLFGSARTGALLDTLPGEGRVTVQLFGRDPAALAEAARRIEGERGAALEAIDLNFGCPAPKITGNGEGSALMREPALCGRIVAAVAAAVCVPVTAKLRKGFDAAHENAVEVARICADSGAAMLTVHGRTREQRYGGLADWGCVAAVAAAVRVPVIGNGDIASGAQALRRLSESGCAGVMVGRAALGNPWIFAEIRAALSGAAYTPPDEAARTAMALRHARMAAAYGGERALIELRKHLARYVGGRRAAASLRARLQTARTLGQIEEILLDTRTAQQYNEEAHS